VYINAKHDRFEHSLGVAHLAEKMARSLKDKQPQLKITEKDIICVKLAGLCHDLGHGPFSHVYDGAFKERVNPTSNWTHEQGSLMMIDQVLKELGLKARMDVFDENIGIEELLGKGKGDVKSTKKPRKKLASVGDGNDNDNGVDHVNEDELDDGDDAEKEKMKFILSEINKPLEQIGDGYRAEKFGVPDRKNSGKFSPITTRDIIFIKECITGETISKDRFIGRDTEKEFLYDIVSNRHNGLDVDKMDYFVRDGVRCKATKYDSSILLEESFVAKGRCPRPDKCKWCLSRRSHQESAETNFDGEKPKPKLNLHYMVCWPEKIVTKAMEFFKWRFSMHSSVYTHKTVKAVEFMVCDILTAANDFIKIPTRVKGEFKRISTAFEDPESYLRLKDGILDVIENSEDENLAEAQALLKRLRCRDLYKCCLICSNNEAEMNKDTFKHIWDGWNPDKILWRIVKASEDIVAEQREKRKSQTNGHDSDDIEDTTQIHDAALEYDDLIIEQNKIHHGMKDKNPVNLMRFLSKTELSKINNQLEDLPEAKQLKAIMYAAHIPKIFQEKNIRLFVKDHGKCRLACDSFHRVLGDMKRESAESLEDGSELMSQESQTSQLSQSQYSQDEYFDDEDNSQTLVVETLSPSPKPSRTNQVSLSQHDDDEDHPRYKSKKGKQRNTLNIVKANSGLKRSNSNSNSNSNGNSNANAKTPPPAAKRAKKTDCDSENRSSQKIHNDDDGDEDNEDAESTARRNLSL